MAAKVGKVERFRFRHRSGQAGWCRSVCLASSRMAESGASLQRTFVRKTRTTRMLRPLFTTLVMVERVGNRDDRYSVEPVRPLSTPLPKAGYGRTNHCG